MRTIALFDVSEPGTDTRLPYNLAAGLARKGKRVLLLDLRQKTLPAMTERNIYHCINEHLAVDRYALELEENLFVVPGSPDLAKIEFHLSYELFKRTYLERHLVGLSYDYIILAVSPLLSLITVNVLSAATEAVSLVPCTPDGYDYQEKLNRFLHYFKRLYGKELFFSRVVPYFSGKAQDEKSYGLFASELSRLLVSSAVPADSRHSGFRAALSDVVARMIEDEARFDMALAGHERQRQIEEYYQLPAPKEKTLVAFGKPSEL